MASAAVQVSAGHGPGLAEKPAVPVSEKPHHVQTILNFFKANEDGSPPAPAYVGKPETYDRPSEPLATTIHDISGHELDYTLDGQGFQLYYHESKEKEFLDDEKIKREYYPETEQLLKDAYVFTFFFPSMHGYLHPQGSRLYDPDASQKRNIILILDSPSQNRRFPSLHIRPHNPSRRRKPTPRPSPTRPH
jgi:hypothetical protein